MATVTIDIDLPDGVTINGYQRHDFGHGFEVNWACPTQFCCPRCRQEGPARWQCTGKVRVLRDLDIHEQPSFWTYGAAFHRCENCRYRQDLIPPFKRKDASYTLRFEEQVVRLMIGSTESDVARRLGISAETVARIVNVQTTEARTIDPQRVITDLGFDEISLKKRHKLYVTIMTDMTDPANPRTLAVVPGRDEAAARRCLEMLTLEQRKAVKHYRVDMGQPYNNACAELLPNAEGVIDRFHVAKLFNDAIDGERKKNHPWLQGETDEGGAQGVSLAHVGVSPRSYDADQEGQSQAGTALHQAAGIAVAV